MTTIRRIPMVAAALLFAVGCQTSGKAEGSARYVRESAGCRCAEMMGGPGKCQCNHCAGEPGAKCYCGTGGCECGGKMPKCKCGHCTGRAGGDDGKGNCL
ncbi:MAG: hypothetical protein L0216_11325 [Planctomycetales bacterium]|nr:hypothetical protein [Planctomycetales bacterium]